jgi:hypothetical protein
LEKDFQDFQCPKPHVRCKTFCDFQPIYVVYSPPLSSLQSLTLLSNTLKCMLKGTHQVETVYCRSEIYLRPVSPTETFKTEIHFDGETRFSRCFNVNSARGSPVVFVRFRFPRVAGERSVWSRLVPKVHASDVSLSETKDPTTFQAAPDFLLRSPDCCFKLSISATDLHDNSHQQNN